MSTEKITTDDLDGWLLEFPQKGGPSAFWTCRNSFESLGLFGSLGSGKTSGSGSCIAKKFLKAGYGGLVLTVKPDEKELWESYCAETGRSQDLLVIEPGQKFSFNFLEFESSYTQLGRTPTENLVQVLKAVINSSEEQKVGGDDAFWDSALNLLLYNTIDLCQLAYGKVTIDYLYEIVQTLPKAGTQNTIEGEKKTAFKKAMDIAFDNVMVKVAEWTLQQSDEMKEICRDKDLRHIETMKAIPDYRLFHYVDTFFTETYRSVSEKTRGVIDFTFAGFLYGLMQEPVYSLFCKNPSTITPEACLKGKIILVNLPLKIFQKVGKNSQLMFKYIWQRCMERRDVSRDGGIPVFCWVDEASYLLLEQDSLHLATARSSRIANVFIFQNLPQVYAAMGGNRYKERAESFLGALGTKIFHANSCSTTNNYASALIGDALHVEESQSETLGKDFSMGISRAPRFHRLVRPEEFISLKTGGPPNNFVVQAIFHKQGDPLFNGFNHKKVVFLQNVKSSNSNK